MLNVCVGFFCEVVLSSFARELDRSRLSTFSGIFEVHEVDGLIRRKPLVAVSVLGAFLDETPLMSSAALLTMRQRKLDLREVFDEIDADRSGHIDRVEVKQLLQRLWERDVSDGEAEEALAAIDTDEDKQVSFHEFTAWYMKSDQRLEEELNHKFDVLDTDVHRQAPPSEPPALSFARARALTDYSVLRVPRLFGAG